MKKKPLPPCDDRDMLTASEEEALVRVNTRLAQLQADDGSSGESSPPATPPAKKRKLADTSASNEEFWASSPTLDDIAYVDLNPSPIDLLADASLYQGWHSKFCASGSCYSCRGAVLSAGGRWVHPGPWKEEERRPTNRQAYLSRMRGGDRGSLIRENAVRARQKSRNFLARGVSHILFDLLQGMPSEDRHEYFGGSQ